GLQFRQSARIAVRMAQHLRQVAQLADLVELLNPLNHRATESWFPDQSFFEGPYRNADDHRVAVRQEHSGFGARRFVLTDSAGRAGATFGQLPDDPRLLSDDFTEPGDEGAVRQFRVETRSGDMLRSEHRLLLERLRLGRDAQPYTYRNDGDFHLYFRATLGAQETITQDNSESPQSLLKGAS